MSSGLPILRISALPRSMPGCSSLDCAYYPERHGISNDLAFRSQSYHAVMRTEVTMIVTSNANVEYIHASHIYLDE